MLPALTKTILPHLCIGMDLCKHAIKTNSSNTFRKRCRQTYFHAFEPQDLYQSLFGSISTGEAENDMKLAQTYYSQWRTSPYIIPQDYQKMKTLATVVMDGFREMNGLRGKLASVSNPLKTTFRLW